MSSALATKERPELHAGRHDHDQYQDLAPLFEALDDRDVPRPRRERAREELITGYLPVAQHIARRYRAKGKPLDDLEQVATVGLIHAIDRFDPGRGADFLSFAVPTITGEVRKHFRDTGWAVRVPRRLQESCQTINKAVAELGHELQRAPRPSEIARHLGCPLEEVLEGLAVANAYNADPLPSDQGGEQTSAIHYQFGAEDHGLIDVEDQATLYPALRELPERERTIVLLRFFHNMTQSQIARRMGISQMHVSRLLTQSFHQLRDTLSGDGLPNAS